VAVTPFLGTDQRRVSTSAGAVLADQDRHDLVAGLRASYAAPLGEGLGLTLGLDSLLDRARLARTGTLTIPHREGDRFVFGQPPGDDVNQDDWTVTGGEVAGFASLALRRGAWTLAPELRAGAFPIAGSRLLPRVGATPPIGYDRLRWAADPRASVVYQPRAALALTAAGGLYHQPVDPADLSAVFGSPGLGPSRAVQGALGIWWRHPAATLELTGFGRLASDLVLRSPLPSPPLAGALVQDGRGRTSGAQLLVRREASARLSGWIAYTIARSDRRHAGEPARLADFDRTHVLTAVASWRLDGRGQWTLGGRARYATGLPRTPVTGASYDLRDDRWDPIFGATNSVRLPALFQIDLRLERTVALGTTTLDLSLDVQNVTDHANAEEIIYTPDYRSAAYIHGLPVLAVAGARWRF
jgi:hypothetical protein